MSEPQLIPRELLITGAEQMGINLTIEHVNSLFVYLVELKKWNQKMNLTAIREDRDIIIKHVLDSLSYLRGFKPAPSQRLLDIGSGAGFPGIPIKIIHPEIEVILVESVQKKVSFLRHIVRTLKLANIEVIDKRVENIPKMYFETIDIITARAFADMKSAIVMGYPFLKTGGLMVFSRGPNEIIGNQDMEALSITLENRIDFVLPYSDYPRAIWVLRKR